MLDSPPAAISTTCRGEEIAARAVTAPPAAMPGAQRFDDRGSMNPRGGRNALPKGLVRRTDGVRGLPPFAIRS